MTSLLHDFRDCSTPSHHIGLSHQFRPLLQVRRHVSQLPREDFEKPSARCTVRAASHQHVVCHVHNSIALLLVAVQ